MLATCAASSANELSNIGWTPAMERPSFDQRAPRLTLPLRRTLRSTIASRNWSAVCARCEPCWLLRRALEHAALKETGQTHFRPVNDPRDITAVPHGAIQPLRRGHEGKLSYHRDMTTQYPAIGSKWKERDVRVARTVEIIRYDVAKRRVRIACLETERLTWAKLERFNGKSGGYAPY